MAFREALRRHGLPGRVYYDNGGPYRSKHMKQIVAVLSNQKPIYTPPRRPEGHGKIEAFNRLCNAAFVDEVQASSITNLDQLNRAFRAWVDLKYNRTVHGETGQTPWDRWRTALDRIVHVDERSLVDAFLFRDQRTTDKAGVLKLHGVRYQVGPALARKKVEVRYDPERMDQIEVWCGEVFQERVRPLEVLPHRRPVKPKAPMAPEGAAASDEAPVVDWLGYLTAEHTPEPLQDAIEVALAERRAQDDVIVEMLLDKLASQVFDEASIRSFLDRYGPLDAGGFGDAVDFAIEQGGEDQHVAVLLTTILDALEAG